MKNRTKQQIRIIAGLFLILLAIPQPAAAYADPGSGALIWQTIAAGLIGSLFYVRRLATRLRNLFHSEKSPTKHS